VAQASKGAKGGAHGVAAAMKRQMDSSMSSGMRDGQFVEAGGGAAGGKGKGGAFALAVGDGKAREAQVHSETMKVLARHTGEGWGGWSEEWRMAVLKVHLHDATDGWEARRQHRRASNALQVWESEHS